jgi:hypothetical protein
MYMRERTKAIHLCCVADGEWWQSPGCVVLVGKERERLSTLDFVNFLDFLLHNINISFI